MHRIELFRLTYIHSTVLLVCLAVSGCAKDWPAFRQNVLRTGGQLNKSPISDPNQVSSLHVNWSWASPTSPRGFRTSPIIYKGRVHIGSSDGYLYTLNASTGALLWQYPATGSQALVSQFNYNPSSYGIAATAIIARIGGIDAVIFGAPDPSIGPGLGSGRLFALNAETGAQIWKSPEIARLTGTTPRSTSEFHEQIGYSAPVVYDGRVYVGVGDHSDNPIQNGRVVAVNLSNGSIDSGFSFSATSTRGGGVWSPIGAWLDGIYITTGNVRCWNGGCQTEPSTNRSLALVRLDPSTGAVIWKFQPVPFSMDDDPDWAAGPTTLLSSCGTLIASTMKDGWTYAIDAGNGTPSSPNVRWQFPPTGFPFTPGDGTDHGDSRFLRPGAAWKDVFITNAGGWDLTTSTGIQDSYPRLYALNVCDSNPDRVRWIKDIPNVSGSYSLGPPTVTRGIVFVGTRDGRFIVLADPSVHPPDGYRCSHPDMPTTPIFGTTFCQIVGFRLVPDPHILASVQLQGAIYTEPALANGRVYVSTTTGWLYALEP